MYEYSSQIYVYTYLYCIAAAVASASLRALRHCSLARLRTPKAVTRPQHLGGRLRRGAGMQLLPAQWRRTKGPHQGAAHVWGGVQTPLYMANSILHGKLHFHTANSILHGKTVELISRL